jgi:hypothetical protein
MRMPACAKAAWVKLEQSLKGDDAARFYTAEAAKVIQAFFHAAALTGHDHCANEDGDDASGVGPIGTGEDDALAPSIIGCAYCGYRSAISAALAYDLVS